MLQKLQHFTTKDHSDPANYASALLFFIFLVLLASIGFFEKLILFYFIFKKIAIFETFCLDASDEILNIKY